MSNNPEQFTHSFPDITSNGWINAKVREGKLFINLTDQSSATHQTTFTSTQKTNSRFRPWMIWNVKFSLMSVTKRRRLLASSTNVNANSSSRIVSSNYKLSANAPPSTPTRVTAVIAVGRKVPTRITGGRDSGKVKLKRSNARLW